MTKSARVYIGAVIAAGAATLAFALTHWRTDDPNRFAIFLLLFLAAATIKCVVPGVTGTYSPVFFFALLGSTTLSFSEVVTAAAMAAIVQSIYKPKWRPTPIKLAFNASTLAVTTAVAYALIQRKTALLAGQPELLGIVLGAAAFYFVNTGLVATVITLHEKCSLSAIWKNWCVGSLGYYGVGVLILGIANPAMHVAATIVVPAVLLATVYFRFRPQAAVQTAVN